MAPHFGNWLRDAIASLPLTIAEFCRRNGIPRSTLTGWLAETRPGIRNDCITRLANGLGIPRDEVKVQLGLIEPAEMLASSRS